MSAAPRIPAAGFLLALALLAFGAPACGKEAQDDRFVPVPANETIPVRDFMRPSLFEIPKLNRSGTHLAALFSNSLGGHKMVIEDLESGTTDYFDAYEFHWLTDKLLMYYFSGKSSIVDITNLHPKWYNNISRKGEGRASFIAGIPRCDKPPIWAWSVGNDGGPCEILLLGDMIAFAPYDKPSTGTYLGYSLDKDDELAFAYTESNGVTSLHTLVNQNLWNRCPVDLDKVTVIGPGDKDGEILVLGPRQPGQPRPIQRMDAFSGRLGEVLYQDRRYDYCGGGLYRSPVSRRLLGIQFYRKGLQTVWVDPKYRAIQGQLDLRFHGLSVSIAGSDDAEHRFIVEAWSDTNPGAYYLLDIEKHSVGLLKKRSPWIDPARMRPMQTVSYRARDGYPIEAYLTLPAGASRENPAPLVVLPHGGPWARDIWGFNAWVQFLANRGYAVLQPNYRGSTGYDWRFPEGDLWEFQKMHNDVTDGTKAMIGSGLIDRNRVAIMGGSFGGYLALCGAAYEGDLYRCAISLSGVFDWARVMKESKVNLLADNPQLDLLRRHLGDPATEGARFDQISPLRHIDRVRIPVFVYHGNDDPVASVSESRRLVDALKDNSVTYEEHFLDDEGHGLSKPDDAAEIFTDIEAFLARYMAPQPASASAGPAQGSSRPN